MNTGEHPVMPIIFEDRLGNSESDRKLIKVYRLHNILWTLYYILFFAGFGFGIAILVGVNGSPIFALLIAVLTLVVLILFSKKQLFRRQAK